MSKMNEYFFMRDGFSTFSLEPKNDRNLLFGERDRAQRDHLLEHLEESSYSLEGYKSVVLGDFGRGKTHQSMNLEYEINRRNLDLYPIYIKCVEYSSKEAFGSFFKEFIESIDSELLKEMAQTYKEKINKSEVPSFVELVDDEYIAKVFNEGLTAPNIEIVRLCKRWLGGAQKLKMDSIDPNLPHLDVSRSYGNVMKGVVQLFKVTKGKVPLYLIDEAQRFGLVTNTDAYWSWLAALREIAEQSGVALIFFIGAVNRDDLPAMFLNDELMSRIGVSNYVEFFNQGRDELANFLTEMLQTIIRKGPIPEPLREALSDRIGKEVDEDASEELKSLVNEHNEKIETYPFTEDGFNDLIEKCATAHLSNRPRELLKLTQKAAGRAIRKNARLIDSSIIEEITKEGI